MRIAICDDNRDELLRVLELLVTYRERTSVDIRWRGFESAVELLATLEREEYDLLLLDVMMPGFSGIQAAQELRRRNDAVKIVFLTSSSEFAVESYSVQAANYLLKPATGERLFPVLDKLLADLQRPENVLTVRGSGSVLRIPYRKLESVEVLSKTLYFHLTDGTLREIRGTLAEYEPLLLSHPEFHKVHRSYLVNFHWVTEVRPAELITTMGHHIPITRTAYQQVRTAYLEFLFAEGLNEKGGGAL